MEATKDTIQRPHQSKADRIGHTEQRRQKAFINSTITVIIFEVTRIAIAVPLLDGQNATNTGT